MTEPTPGPWMPHHGLAGPWTVYARGGPNIAMIDPTLPDEGMADARLIAAAPDLLAAAEGALFDLEVAYGQGQEPTSAAPLRAAISKARGSTPSSRGSAKGEP